MVSVTAKKIRELGHEAARAAGRGRPAGETGRATPGRAYSGYLISYPTVGRGMVIFRDPNGHRMVTTPVQRVLGEFGSEEIFVETENSVYKLTFRSQAREQEAIRPAARVSVSGDGK